MAITKVDSSMLEDVGGARGLVQLDSNAKIPAGPAGGLSVMPGPLTSASDPTVSSNKTLGTEWLNSTSGEMYICTDATTNANIWTNVGAGTGNIIPYSFQGSNYGYAMGAGPGPYTNVIQKFSFTSAADSVDVSNLVGTNAFAAGCSSATYGYCIGGYGHTNVIQKHQFGTTNNSTDVGDLLSGKTDGKGVSSETYGFHCGGYPHTADIQKFSFSTDGNATDHGDLAITHSAGAGMNSSTHGYVSGGNGGNTQRDKFAFASNTTAVDDGNHFAGHHSYLDGVSSSTHGYVAGGAQSGAGATNIIDKFAYASGGQSTDVGDLTQNGYEGAGVSSNDYGYKAGGGAEPANTMDRIEKWTFASDNNSVDTGANMLAFNAQQQSHGYHAPAQY